MRNKPILNVQKDGALSLLDGHLNKSEDYEIYMKYLNKFIISEITQDENQLNDTLNLLNTNTSLIHMRENLPGYFFPVSHHDIDISLNDTFMSDLI